jgi:hypothetical protein
MAATEVNARWQADMARSPPGLTTARRTRGFELLEEVFNLEDQLGAHRTD